MTPAERLAAALLEADVPALHALLPGLDGPLAEVARAGLARLDPSLPAGAVSLPSGAVVLLRAVSGRPGLSAVELRELVGDAADAAGLLLERGLVTSRRFDRTDCWSRTALGAQVLRGLER